MEYKLLTKNDLMRKIPEFENLFKSCFSAEINKDIVCYRFIENPYEDLLMYVAEENEKFVALYAALPMKLSINGKVHKIGLSVNTMTHPDYKGQGLFPVLEKKLTEYMKNHGYLLICGFPNYLSNRIFCSKLGWKDVYEIPTLEYKVTSGVKENIDLSLCEIDNWDKIDFFCDDKIQIFKEKKYLDWRYRNNIPNRYHVLYCKDGSWAIYHFYKKEMNITEYHLADSVDGIKNILEYLSVEALKFGAEKITTWAGINTQEHYFFEKYGFINSSPVRYFAVKKLNYDDFVDLFDYNNWHIYMGDDNVY